MVVIASAIGLPAPVLADADETSLGAAVVGLAPQGAGLAVLGRYGLNDWSAATAQTSAFVTRDGFHGSAELGVTLLFDVFAWVPELALSAGVSGSRDGLRPCYASSVGLRHFLSMDLSLGASLGVRVEGRQLYGVAALSFWQTLD